MEKVRLYWINFGMFVFSVVSYLVCLFLYYITWVHGYDDTAELIGAGTSFLLGISIICGPVALIQFFLYGRKKGKILLVILLVAMMEILAIVGTRNLGKNVLTLTIVQEKGQREDECYLVIRNLKEDGVVQLQCNQDAYEQIQTDGKNVYLLNYRVLQEQDEKGYLVSIQGECMLGM
ncbi:MAG: hypothetical protein ACI4ES_03015 [Roseburia sp.]